MTFRRIMGVVLVSASLALTGAAPAGAHPSDKPQVLRLSSDGSVVHVRWMAAPDDLAEIARALGLADEPRTFVFEDGELVPEESDETDVELLEGSREVKTYLLDTIGVRQEGSVCPGKVTRVGHLDHDGARLRFDCPSRVTDVDVTVTTMTDIDPGYRTAARSSLGDRATYTNAHPTRAWRLAEPQQGLGPAGWLLAVVTLLVVVGAVVLVIGRRRVPAPSGKAADQPVVRAGVR